ncbi:hypothetical protein DdX_21881 [Ditylenchus destructor]|uniref:Uncharacterized protein n=1 Tax=Ditylenchus destructor TaxID=166010 RepID=A0AAD4QVA3_9BILA|nr:hypothetical protein DdX_21881 [Ditylenchus destructor]
MSCSKFLHNFAVDVLCYVDRNKLDDLMIVSGQFKNYIDKHFRAKPYRVFEELLIGAGTFILKHHGVQWHPNREDYNVLNFLDGVECSLDADPKRHGEMSYYSFSEMQPYLGPTVRFEFTFIHTAGQNMYSNEHIMKMESLTHLWREGTINFLNCYDGRQIVPDNIRRIFSSPIILQCRDLVIYNACFSFKDYGVLYMPQSIQIFLPDEQYVNPNIVSDYLEQMKMEQIVMLQFYSIEFIPSIVERILQSFSKIDSSTGWILEGKLKKVHFQAFSLRQLASSGFTMLLGIYHGTIDQSIEFQKVNNVTGEKLELKKGLPQPGRRLFPPFFQQSNTYTMIRSVYKR